MIDRDTAFEALRNINPVPGDQTGAPPTIEEILEKAKTQDGQAELVPIHRGPRSRRTGPLVAVATFVTLVVVGALFAWLVGSGSDAVDSPDTIGPPTPSSVTSSTVATGAAFQVSPADLQVIDDFATAYSFGDYDELRSMAPDLTFSWQRLSDPPVPWTEAELRARYEIDAALETRLSFVGCQQLAAERVSCVILRDDALVRGVGIDPPTDVRWRFTLADGAVSSIEEITPDVSDYDELAKHPFLQWLQREHPEIENPGTGFRGSPWRADTDFADVAAELVAEWVASDLSN